MDGWMEQGERELLVVGRTQKSQKFSSRFPSTLGGRRQLRHMISLQKKRQERQLTLPILSEFEWEGEYRLE